MRVTDKSKLKEALELLEQAQQLINDSVQLEDCELHTRADDFNTIGDVMLNLEELSKQPEIREGKED